MIGRGLIEALALLKHRQHRGRFHVFGKAVAEFRQGVGSHVYRAHLFEDVTQVEGRWISVRLALNHIRFVTASGTKQ